MRKPSFLDNVLVYGLTSSKTGNFICMAGNQAPGESAAETDSRKAVDKFVSEYSDKIDAAGNDPKKIAEVLEKALADLARIRGTQIDHTVSAQQRAIGVLVDRVCKVGDPVQDKKLRDSLQPQVDAINKQIEEAGEKAAEEIERARKLEEEEPISDPSLYQRFRGRKPDVGGNTARAIGELKDRNSELEDQLKAAEDRANTARDMLERIAANTPAVQDAAIQARLNKVVAEGRVKGLDPEEAAKSINNDWRLTEWARTNGIDLVTLTDAYDEMSRSKAEIQRNNDQIDLLLSQAEQATATRRATEVAPFAPQNTVAKAEKFAKKVAEARADVLKGKDKKEKKEVRYAAKSISQLMEEKQGLQDQLKAAEDRANTARDMLERIAANTPAVQDAAIQARLNKVVAEGRVKGLDPEEAAKSINNDWRLTEWARTNGIDLVTLTDAYDEMSRLPAQINDIQFEIDRLAGRAGRSTARRQATEDALAPKSKPKPTPVAPPAVPTGTPQPLYADMDPGHLGTLVVPGKGGPVMATLLDQTARAEKSGDVVERVVKKGEYMTKITKESYGSIDSALWQFLQKDSLGEIKTLKGEKASLIKPGDVIKLPKTVKIGDKTYTRKE